MADEFMELIGVAVGLKGSVKVEDGAETNKGTEIKEDIEVKEEVNEETKVEEEEGEGRGIKNIYEEMLRWKTAEQFLVMLKGCVKECRYWDKCGGEVEVCKHELRAGYAVMKNAIGIMGDWPEVGGKRWCSKWAVKSHWSRQSIIEMAGIKAQIVRCDLDLNLDGVRLLEKTEFFDSKSGELIKSNEKHVSNPSIMSKNLLMKSYMDLSDQLMLSEKQKDVRKTKGSEFVDGPLAKMIAAFGRVQQPEALIK